MTTTTQPTNAVALVAAIINARKQDLTGTDLAILLTLRDRAEDPLADPLSMTDVSKLFGVSTGALTGLADKLELQDLIKRSPKPGDRRVNLLRITEPGKELLAAILTPEA